MIDPVEFFDLVSDKANRDSKIRGNFLAYIDENYDPSRYPQELPRVMNPGQPLSHKGYVCLDSYRPMPGDRVLLVPAGVSDYVIIGASEPSYEDQEMAFVETNPEPVPFERGDRVCTLDNHDAGQSQANGTTGSYLQWSAQQYTDMGGANDPFGFWGGLQYPPVTQLVSPSHPGFYRIEGRVVFPAATGGTADWRRVRVEDAASSDILRGGDFSVSNINSSTLRTVVIFSTPPLWFTGSSSNGFRLLCAGSVGGGSSYAGGGAASFVNVYYEGYF